MLSLDFDLSASASVNGEGVAFRSGSSRSLSPLTVDVVADDADVIVMIGACDDEEEEEEAEEVDKSEGMMRSRI